MLQMKRFSTTILFVLLITSLTAQEKPDFLRYTNSRWVDSVMKSLSPEERIGQLIMVAAYSNRGPEHKEELLKLIENYKIGGLIFFQGDPVSQVKLMNSYQQISDVPLLGAIDAEWGLGMRLDSTISFPFQMALGAVQNNDLIYQMGVEIAQQIKKTGLHMNFAPVVDVNNNPDNPVINYRSFGEDKYNVTEKSIAYLSGMQDQQILATAKHFPGHGDTDTDSHYALPQINHTRKRLDTLELFPFRKVIEAGVGGVMVAHLDIPALDSTGVPSTLSKPIVTDLLKKKMDFKGIVVTDAMNMKGVTEGNLPGVVDKDALLAGNDLLEFTEDVPKAIEEIKKAIDLGLISQQQINRRVRKILALKQWVGLNKNRITRIDNLVQNLNTPEAKLLNRQLVAASLTLLKNNRKLIPVANLGEVRIASLSIGRDSISPFQNTLELYTDVDHYNLPADASENQVDSIEDGLEAYDIVIVGLHDQSKFPKNVLEYSEEVVELIGDLSEEDQNIIAVFKNPYVLQDIEDIEEAEGLIIAYQDSDLTQELTAQLIFGGIGASGKLPVSIGDKFKAGDGLETTGGIRFEYTLPEAVGMDSEFLYQRIDSLMQEAMDAKATPGGQILVAKEGKIIFYKAYGYHRYSDTIKVERTDLYDLASVTKISSALPALMKLYDEGKFDLEAGIEDYLPSFKGSNKAGIPFHQILTHQARFKPWIPYWRNTLRNNGSYKWNTFKNDSSARYPVRITENLWLHRKYKKKIFRAIEKSPLEEKAEYKYSGLVFYLLPTIVENLSGENFREYINEEFYNKLGATTLTYNPREQFPLERIVPTESDFLFRHQPIHGDVHDEGAIMMGGVSANAGLFSNANDLAKLMQMYLNFGTYGGERFIEESTLREWTKTQFPENGNHRALGFDKPYLEYEGEDSNTAKDASKSSFGHTGFTGIYAWADPENDLLYLFLSNRVLPSRENTRLYQLNTRTKIQQVIYDALEEKSPNKE